MYDPNKLIIRPATLDDVEFIATTIIEAEKSSTDKIGPANYFEVSEEDYRRYLILMLEEEIDGCEISISSFVVAEYAGEVIAARGGWLEGDNEDHAPSSLLKSNLFAYFLPRENLMKGQSKYDIVKDIMIEREMGTYQLENSYTKAAFRGLHIMGLLDSYHINIAIKKGVKKIQAHVSKDNIKSLRACERSGFHVVRYFTSHHPQVKDYYPDDTMVLLERIL
ncbi:MAG: GNAT family N-acetyltransferase [Bacteroidales bacterium]|nr:GNAT family N-acetyltransferase [Bacteroidales bacterium]